MDGGNSNKRKGEALQEEESDDKRQNVTMATDFFDCPTCSQPLRPPIFQCSKGNFICSPCLDKLPESERTASQRCHGMERIVDNIVVRCKHGCRTKYYQKEEHEMGCPEGPCFCPVSGCGFVAGGMALLDHLTTLHKLPTNFICSPCRDKLPESKWTASPRCYGMERIVNNIVVCCKHGCRTKYYQKEEHERGCPEGPCFCLVSGCGFVAGGAALLDYPAQIANEKLQILPAA